ncbi:MAG: S1C family serine protease [Tuberibacillus sp.]
MRNKHFILSTIISLIFLIAAGFAYYYLSQHYSNLKITKASGIIQPVVNTSKTTTTATDLKTVIHNSQKDVVQISVVTQNEEVIGSGFIYNELGDIITNAHVVSGASTVTVKTSDAQTYEGKVIGIGDKIDIAVVRVHELAGVTPIKINRTKKAEIGDQVIALGSPLGLQNTVTTGIISGVDRSFTIDPFDYKNMYQISASITHGNSGGPLLDRKTGEAIAINSAGTEEGDIGFSIPLMDVMNQIEDWSKNPQEITGINGADGVSGTSESKDSLTQDAEYIVNYFYESLAARDYVTAYMLLGSDWQKNTSYEAFRKGYLNTLDLTINDISSKVTDNNRVQVTVIISADEQTDKGEVVTNQYKSTYIVGYENDQLKMIDGRGEQITDKKSN